MKLPGITDLPPHVQKPFADYIRSYRGWRLDGAPDGEPYRRRWGLCDNAQTVNFELRGALSDAFWEISGTDYPFGRENYWQRIDDETQPFDPARIAYEGEIIKQAKELGI